MDLIATISETVISLFWIILGFGALIFVHELGHFLAAKWAGIRAEAFAVGMGPVMFAWRSGMGVKAGSTATEYERRTRELIEQKIAAGEQVIKPGGELRIEDIYRAGDELGLGETEYSLRWLPIGGFVKMLGQEDANPEYVSDDPRSYNRCSIGKRMIVVSAGVIMNIILAAILFVWAFMVGVRLEAPVIGQVASTRPAGLVVADNADQLGVTEPGLQPGDRIVSIDGDPAHTFADISIASAMSRPGLPVRFAVEREGVDDLLRFSLAPEHDAATGMRSIGVAPARSTTLIDKDDDGQISAILEQVGLLDQGVRPGMRLLSVNGRPASTFEQLAELVAQSDGSPVTTSWGTQDEQGERAGARVEATLELRPRMQPILYPTLSEDNFRDYELGLIGLSPLTMITQVPSSSHNVDVLQAGDVVLRVEDLNGPRQTEFRQTLQRHKGDAVELELLRDDKPVVVQARVNRKGMIGITIGSALDVPLIARPFTSRALPAAGKADTEVVPTPVASLQLPPGTMVTAVNDRAVSNWRDLWIALRDETTGAHASGTDATLSLGVTLPTPNRDHEDLDLTLTADDVRDLQDLDWTCGDLEVAFDAIYTVRSAEGNPVTALTMGVQETHKVLMITYLTIDRLVRRTVGVEQLRGPVGIVHIGVNIVDRGFIYMLFFFGMISVNLAVINFLPLPIVDGGLFLFLIYEKLKGKPPSIAFQNAATIVGLCLIGTIFLVTFYNDVMRLFS